MSSPHQKLTEPMLPRWLRRSIMIFWFVCFFVLSPIMIAYTSGYRINITTGHIQKRGVLSIDIKPNNAHVYINDVSIEKKLPMRLTNRAPGIYTIRLEAPGYISWEQKIEIKSNQTSYIRDVTLLRIPSPTYISIGDNSTAIYNFPTAEYSVLFQTEETTETLSALHNKNHTLIPLARDIDTQHISFDTSPFLPYISFITKKPSTRLHIVSLSNPAHPTTFDLTHHVQRLQWTKDKFNPAYIQQDSTIYELSFVSGDMTPQYTLQNPDTLWYIDTAHTVWTYSDHILTRSDTGNTYTIETPLDHIHMIENNTVIATHEDETVVLHISDNTVNEERFQGTSYVINPYNQSWIVWSPWEIHTIDTNGTVHFLTRSSDYIEHIGFLNEKGLLFLNTRNGIYAFNPSYYVWNTIELTDIRDISTAPPDTTLFYITHAQKLYKTIY